MNDDRPHRLIAFDLDDTLYKERDFVESGFKYVAAMLARDYHLDYNEMMHVLTTAPVHAFDSLLEYITNRGLQHGRTDLPSVDDILTAYRTHHPDIHLTQGAMPLLEQLTRRGDTLALITDGRVATQSAKIKALGLDRIIPTVNISISEAIGAEKTSSRPFERIAMLNPGYDQYIYVADNPMKDFVWPNRLGWLTVMLRDNGRNVHSQHISLPQPDYAPNHIINALADVVEIIP